MCVRLHAPHRRTSLDIRLMQRAQQSGTDTPTSTTMTTPSEPHRFNGFILCRVLCHISMRLQTQWKHFVNMHGMNNNSSINENAEAPKCRWHFFFSGAHDDNIHYELCPMHCMYVQHVSKLKIRINVRSIITTNNPRHHSATLIWIFLCEWLFAHTFYLLDV